MLIARGKEGRPAFITSVEKKITHIYTPMPTVVSHLREVNGARQDGPCAASDRSIPSNICVGLEARVPSEELTVTQRRCTMTRERDDDS